MKLFFKREDGGFTTVGAAVAMLLVLALLMTAMQAYWIGTRSGNIQYVADSAALAADGAVAEFVTYGQAVDAVLLSFSLVGVCLFAGSAVAAFIPGAQAVATSLAEAGTKVMQVREQFTNTAQKGLDAAQSLLPAWAAFRAGQVVSANAQASGIDYYGSAVVLPTEGVSISLSDGGTAAAAMEQLAQREEEISDQAQSQSQAQQEADAAKEQGWLADCGYDGMNMQERAGHLAGLSGGSNPDYSSPDGWNFSVALARAQRYYQARYDSEAGSGASGNPEEVGESVARKRFYAYASSVLAGCSVTTTSSGYEYPNLSALARNTSEIRNTTLYTEAIYPVSSNGGTRTIHAYVGCPAYKSGSPSGTAAVSAIDSGQVSVCDTCHFSVSTLGRVPSASTSINNGFEYYYRELVDAATAYRSAVEQLDESTGRLKELGSQVKSDISEAMKAIVGQRYDPQPPGRYGCVSIVVAPRMEGFTSSLVSGDGHVGARVAISGATLAADPDTEQADVITSLANSFIPDSAIGSGLLKTAFGAWSSVLRSYASGVDGIKSTLSTVLGTIPLAGTSLSSWATGEFEDAMEAAGLQPADLKAYKPVLTNTSHILKADGGKVASALSAAKDAAGYVGSSDAQTLANVLGQLGFDDVDTSLLDSDGLTVASIGLAALGVGLGEAELKLDMPSDLVQRCKEMTARAQTMLGGV